VITSQGNPLIKKVRRLHSRQGRSKYRQYIIEGIRGVDQALDNGASIAEIIYSDRIWQLNGGAALMDRIGQSGIAAYQVDPALFDWVTDTETPQHVLAVVDMPEQELGDGSLASGDGPPASRKHGDSSPAWKQGDGSSASKTGQTERKDLLPGGGQLLQDDRLPQGDGLPQRDGPLQGDRPPQDNRPPQGDRLLLVIIDGLQDPGNLGTIIRTADAAGADGLILLKGTTDPYSPKSVRSSMGSVTGIPIVQCEDTHRLFSDLKEGGVKIAAAALDKDAIPYYSYDYTGRVAIIIGNEAAGISPEVLSYADAIINIPMRGRAESLNAAVACGILLYKAVEQRLPK
jgi:tRNA G18 (ribose-2'-O)-methylase SpoU